MNSYDTLRDELGDHDTHICPEALQAVFDGEIKLSHKAHLEMDDFMIKAGRLFAPVDDIMTDEEIEDQISEELNQ